MRFGRREKKFDIWTSGLPVQAPLPGRRERVDHVPAADSLEIIADVFSPMVDDMTLIRPRHWVKELSDGIRATLDLDAYKGADYEFHYGIACAWVPRLEAGKFVWRRTLKQTRRCLWISHFAVDAPPRAAISTLYGTDVVRRDAEAALAALAPRATNFWRSVDSPRGVLTESQRQAAGPRGGGIIHHPPPGLTTAFTLAKLGEDEAARAYLSQPLGLREGPILESALARLEDVLTDR